MTLVNLKFMILSEKCQIKRLYNIKSICMTFWGKKSKIYRRKTNYKLIVAQMGSGADLKGTQVNIWGKDIEAVLRHDVSQLYEFVKTQTVNFIVFKLYYNKGF